ncbi:MAG: polyamine aminopropyltransferase [Planctomycetota bacterium]|nr:polyamine aminopropyltransferase [Planctomycetota bacterium]
MNDAPLALLYVNVLIIATCGLVYELLAGTLASYVLGDSVTQFSLIIGVYLSALGAGAWVSSFVKKDVARTFVEVELGVALLGGTSAPLLFLCFARLAWFLPVLYGVVFGIGVLVGLELPLLMRILKGHLDFDDLVSKVLTFDYIGALVASLMFPIFLVPTLGLVRTSLVFGILNALVGFWGTSLLRPILTGGVFGLRVRAACVIGLLLTGLLNADSLTSLAENSMFSSPIVHTQTTPYQRIVVTQNRTGFQLYLNGNLQFSSSDEYRYHEALVHPAASVAHTLKNVLVLGGGDGLALRELLRYPSVERVTLVDIDPEMTGLSKSFPPLSKLNGHALKDRRVVVVNDDAMIWLESVDERFDLVLIDFPDPNSFSLGKLYTTRFYRLLRERITLDAMVCIQCTSPLLSRRAYWCIVRTMEAAGFYVRPFHAAVPSFGDWGFALASLSEFGAPTHLDDVVRGSLRFLNDETLSAMFQLPEDLSPIDVEINRLDNQALVRYYEDDVGAG